MLYIIQFLVLFTTLTSAFVPLYRNKMNTRLMNNNYNNKYDKYNKYDKEKLLVDTVEELKNVCCGEVNEKQDIENLEKLERECFEMYQKLTKNNKKNVYKKRTIQNYNFRNF